jgi:superfamily II DNA/RNA helicase
MWSMPLLHDRRLERQLLTALLDAARAAQEADGKLARLCRLVRIVREPLIVFTEYRDTLSHVRRRLGRDAAILHGGMSRDQRREALRQFTELGILLATDAAGEGLNLQEHCRLVVNLELPWNPMRLEQRIGRVDRIGQRRRVHAIHLIGADTREMLLLDRLIDRIGQARARVRAASPLCGRPEWTEELSARLVVGQEDPRTPPEVMSAPPVPLTRLTSEGEAEARRIASLQKWRPPGASSGRSSSSSVRAASAASAGRGPHAATARRGRTRTALQGRSLLVFRTAMRDGAGRTISTRVDGVMARPEAAAPYEASSAARDAITLSVPFREWVRASADAHSRLLQVRARRAAAIAARLKRVPGEQQPGLFERRDERIWRQVDELHSASLDAAADRVAQIHAAEPTALIGPELELLLVPRR